MLLIGMCTSLTKKPTKPMIRKPIIVADAIRANSLRSGLVHFFTRWIESCVCDKCVLRDASRDGGSGRVPEMLVFDAARSLDELLEGLDYYRVDVRHGRCAIWSLRVAVAICVAAATAQPAELRLLAYSASI